MKPTIIIKTATKIQENPNNEKWKDADHWKLILTNTLSGIRRTVYYSQGYAWEGHQPNIADVLDCLAADATYSTDTFEDFCDNFGYNTDSRNAERIYKAGIKNTEKLKDLLGDEFDNFVYDTERY